MSLTLKVPERPTRQGQKVDSKIDELILILNPNSQGGATGKNWNDTYAQIKEFLPKQHRIVFTKKADDGTNITRKPSNHTLKVDRFTSCYVIATRTFGLSSNLTILKLLVA